MSGRDGNRTCRRDPSPDRSDDRRTVGGERTGVSASDASGGSADERSESAGDSRSSSVQRADSGEQSATARRTDGGVATGRFPDGAGPAPGQDATILPSASVAVGVVAAVVGGVLAGIGADLPAACGLAVVAGGTGAAGARLSEPESPWRLAAAGALFVLAGLALGGAVGIATTPGGGVLAAVLVLGVALAVLAAASPRGLTGEAVVRPLLASLAAAVVPYIGAELLGGGAGGAIASITGAIADVVWTTLLLAAWWGNPVSNDASAAFEATLLSGALLVAATVTSVSYALGTLDPARLAPRAERDAVRARIDGIARRFHRRVQVAWVGFGALIVFVVLPVPYDRVPGLAEAGALVLGSPLLRVPVVLALVAVWLALAGVKLALLGSNLRDARPLDWVPAGVGGLAVWLAATVLVVALADPVLHPAVEGTRLGATQLPVVATGVEELLAAPAATEHVAALGTLAALGAVTPAILFGGLAVVERLGFLAGALSAGSIAVASLVVAGLAAGLGGAGSLAVLGPVAGGLVAWDAAAFGAVLTAETDDDVDATGPILAHAAATGGVVILALSFALATVALAGDAVRPAVRVPILLALVAGLGVALWLLARRAADRESRTVAIGLEPVVDAVGGAPGLYALAITPVVAVLLWGGLGLHPFTTALVTPLVFLLVRQFFRRRLEDDDDDAESESDGDLDVADEGDPDVAGDDDLGVAGDDDLDVVGDDDLGVADEGDAEGADGDDPESGEV